MNQSQRELRRAAAQAFVESLDQLGKSLTSVEPTNPSKAAPKDPSQRPFAAELEDAVADIEALTRRQSREEA